MPRKRSASAGKRARAPAPSQPPTAGWWGDGPPPWERWPGVSLRIDAVWCGTRWESPCGTYYFDPERASAPSDFMREFLRQTKGAFAQQPLALLPWQELLLVRPLFGWLRAVDGTRRFRRVFCEVAKKNGKSTLASGLALYLMAGDREPGAEVYAAAGDEEQAKIVWGDAAAMAEESPELLDRAGVEVLAGSITQERTRSFFKPLTSKAATKHGPNIHALIFDELHVQKARSLYETLTHGISARRQPVILVITTAGDDRESICYEEYDAAKKLIATGDGLASPDRLPIVFELPEGADWTDERVWPCANPSLGVAKSLDIMRQWATDAKEQPRKRNDFLRLELNVWTESRTVWITPEAWGACRRDVVEPPDWKSLTCCLGFDLSETVDLTCLVAAFRRPDPRPAEPVEVEGGGESVPKRLVAVDFAVDLKAWFWMPQGMYEERVRERRDGVAWEVWQRAGWLRVTPGDIIDYRAVREVVVNEILPKYRVHEAGFDPYNARQLMPALEDDGLTTVEVRQGFLTMSQPSKLLEGLVRARRITHDGNPLLAWCFANAEVATDPAGNIKPVKPGGDARGSRRIDGVSATVTALARLMVAPSRSSRRAHVSAIG